MKTTTIPPSMLAPCGLTCAACGGIVSLHGRACSECGKEVE